MSAGAAVSALGLTGAGRSTFKNGSLRWLLAEALSFSPHGLSIGLVGCPHIIALTSPRVSDSGEQGRSHNAFCDLGMEIIDCHFHNILLEESH